MRRALWVMAAVIVVGGIYHQMRKSPSQRVNTVKISITGSSTVAPVMAEIAKRYEQAHPEVRIEVQTGGSSRGVNEARLKTADIGMVSRSLKTEESDLQATPIALDGIGMIVHRDSPVTDLNREQIVAIYTGKIQNWKQVGGADLPITVVHKAEGRSTSELFQNFFKLEPKDIKAQVIIGDNEQGIKTIAGNPGAIGYVSVGAAEAAVHNQAAIKLLDFEGTKASAETIKAGTFPMSRPLNLVVAPSHQNPVVEDLIKYAHSAAVTDIVKGQYFVPMAL